MLRPDVLCLVPKLDHPDAVSLVEPEVALQKYALEITLPLRECALVQLGQLLVADVVSIQRFCHPARDVDAALIPQQVAHRLGCLSRICVLQPSRKELHLLVAYLIPTLPNALGCGPEFLLARIFLITRSTCSTIISRRGYSL